METSESQNLSLRCLFFNFFSQGSQTDETSIILNSKLGKRRQLSEDTTALAHLDQTLSSLIFSNFSNMHFIF